MRSVILMLVLIVACVDPQRADPTGGEDIGVSGIFPSLDADSTPTQDTSNTAPESSEEPEEEVFVTEGEACTEPWAMVCGVDGHIYRCDSATNGWYWHIYFECNYPTECFHGACWIPPLNQPDNTCQDPDFKVYDYLECDGKKAYWFNSCGVISDPFANAALECAYVCFDGKCVEIPDSEDEPKCKPYDHVGCIHKETGDEIWWLDSCEVEQEYAITCEPFPAQVCTYLKGGDWACQPPDFTGKWLVSGEDLETGEAYGPHLFDIIEYSPGMPDFKAKLTFLAKLPEGLTKTITMEINDSIVDAKFDLEIKHPGEDGEYLEAWTASFSQEFGFTGLSSGQVFQEGVLVKTRVWTFKGLKLVN